MTEDLPGKPDIIDADFSEVEAHEASHLDPNPHIYRGYDPPIKIVTEQNTRKPLRYILAIIVGAILGIVVSVPIPFIVALLYDLINIIFGADTFSWENLQFVSKGLITPAFNAFATGCIAGWIAGNRGKLVGFLSYSLVLVFILIEKSDIFQLIQNDGWTAIASHPLLLGLSIAAVSVVSLLAILGGHLAVKHRIKSLIFSIVTLWGFLELVIIVAGFAIHIWTIVLAYKKAGFVAAFITSFTPPLSEGFWFFDVWKTTGTINTGYGISILMIIAAFILKLAIIGGLTFVSIKPSFIDPKDW